MRVARTLADLAVEKMGTTGLAEAIQYRAYESSHPDDRCRLSQGR